VDFQGHLLVLVYFQNLLAICQLGIEIGSGKMVFPDRFQSLTTTQAGKKRIKI
jgi:hypothetical protein